MVMAVFAPGSSKSLKMYEGCVSSVIKVLREGRGGGARDFFVTSDFNVELGLMRTDEEDNEELTKMYGPLCRQGYDEDPGGFKKTMWYGITKAIDCNLSSTWSACGKERGGAFAHKHLSSDKTEEYSKLDNIIRPMTRNDEVYIHNERRLWANSDHYPFFLREYKKRHTKNLSKKKFKVDGMEADKRRAISEI